MLWLVREKIDPPENRYETYRREEFEFIFMSKNHCHEGLWKLTEDNQGLAVWGWVR